MEQAAASAMGRSRRASAGWPDWRRNCDRRRTDPEVHLRDAAWYRTRLRRYFHEIGAGFWLRRGAPLTVWELETAR